MNILLNLRKISQMALARGLQRKRDLAHELQVSPTMLGAFLHSRDPLKRNARILCEVLNRQPSEFLEPIDKFRLQEWMAQRRLSTEKALAHEMGISPSSLSMMFEAADPADPEAEKLFDPVKLVARKMAAYFGVTLNEVLDFSEDLPEDFEDLLKY